MYRPPSWPDRRLIHPLMRLLTGKLGRDRLPALISGKCVSRRMIVRSPVDSALERNRHRH